MRAKTVLCHHADTALNVEENLVNGDLKTTTISQSSSTNISNNSVESPTNAAPSKKRRLKNDVVAVVAENQDEFVDDEAEELRNRRLQHIVDTARTFNSPVNSPGGDRRQKILVGKNGMTNVQITEHYSNCLKLSAENKINSKNAFSLHLIDYMSDILRQPDDTDTNFQVAGTTLDASAKIYAYRVDSVHRETFKIAGGLGRSDKETNGREDDEAGAGEDEHGNAIQQPAAKVVKKRRKKITKGNTIETNEKNLNMVVSDSQFAGDALFDKVRSNFDEGGSSGLFLNTLSTFHDSSRLLLHCLVENPLAEPLSPGGDVDMTEIEELVGRIDLNKVKSLVPELGDFSFLGWKPEEKPDKDDYRGKKSTSQETANEDVSGKYAIELPPTPPPLPALAQPDFGLEDEMDNDDFDDNWDRPPSMMAVKDEVQPKSANLDAIASALTSQQLEYSYFDPNVVSTLTGASHWKVQAKLDSLKREHDDDNEAAPAKKGRKVPTRNGQKVGRKRKEEARVDFRQQQDPKILVPTGKTTNSFPLTSLEKWKAEAEASLLADKDPEMDCTLANLKHLITKPDVLLSDAKVSQESVSSEGVVTNDATGSQTENGPSTSGQRTQHEEDEGGMDIDFGALFGGDDNDEDDDGDPLETGDPKELVCEGSHAVDDEQAAGGAFSDGLLQHPYKVNKITVSYARQAKKIDVRRLKRSVWAILTKDDDTDSPQDRRSTLCSPPKKITKPKKFSALCSELPQHVPPGMAENLSVPVIFVCLLHMCNEKTLTLEDQDDMGDFIISSGITDQDDNE